MKIEKKNYELHNEIKFWMQNLDLRTREKISLNKKIIIIIMKQKCWNEKYKDVKIWNLKKRRKKIMNYITK